MIDKYSKPRDLLWPRTFLILTILMMMHCLSWGILSMLKEIYNSFMYYAFYSRNILVPTNPLYNVRVIADVEVNTYFDSWNHRRISIL